MKSQFRVDSRAALLKGGESKRPAVVPGHSAKSPIILFASDLVEEMEMPPKDKRAKFPPSPANKSASCAPGLTSPSPDIHWRRSL